MAVTPKTDETFLREVDEELRRDQMVGVWKQYGRLIVGAVVGGLLLFGAYLGWTAWSRSQAEAEALKLQGAYDAVAAGNAQAAAAPVDDLAANGKPGYQAIARMLQANRLLDAGKAKEAAAKFAEVAADTSLGQPLRDLATIRQTLIEYDALQPQAIIDRLRPLATKDSAWLGSAGEMTAVAYLRLNNATEARKMYKMIAENDNVPQPFRERASQAMATLDGGTNVQKDK